MMFQSHSEKQTRALTSHKRHVVCATGIQWGKTRVGAQRMKRAMHEHTDPDASFIVAVPNYKTLNQSTLPAFLSVMEGCGVYNKSEAIFKMHEGGTCYFRTNTEPDSVVGITNVFHIWGDEAGKFTLYFWENLQARSSFKQCPITITTSPYTLNWIYKELIKPAQKGSRNDVELVRAASNENPYFPEEEFENKRKTMDPRRFNMVYGGEFNRMEGLVYDCWDDQVNLINPIQLPVGTKYYAGVDWGYTDPFVIKIRAITLDGRHYGVSEFYKTGLTPSKMIDIAKQKQQVFNIEKWFCDPSQPGYIEEFQANGLNAEGAENDIAIGVSRHYELIKTGKYKEFIGHCPHSVDERESYHYPEPKDLKPDQNHKEAPPVDQDNHCMDVDRYLSIMTYKRHLKNTPKTPTGMKRVRNRLDFLKQTHKYQSENWS